MRAIHSTSGQSGLTLQVETEGSLNTDAFDDLMLDLTNFLVFMGEPAAEKRKQIGSLVIIFLILFAFMA